jgi:hypothetical protein
MSAGVIDALGHQRREVRFFCRVFSIFTLPIKVGIIHQGIVPVGNDTKIKNLSGASNFYFFSPEACLSFSVLLAFKNF